MLLELLENISSSTTGFLTSLVLVIATVALLPRLYYYLSGPGPWGLPYFGFYPYLHEKFHVQFHELAKSKYGPVFKVNLMGQTFIYVGSFKAAKEVHVTKVDYFPARYDKPSLFRYAFEDGIFFHKGEEWKVQRKFFVQGMRELGLVANKDTAAGPVTDSVKEILNKLKDSNGKVLDLLPVLGKCCANTVQRLFLGEDVSPEDADRLNTVYMALISPIGDKSLFLTGYIARYLFAPFAEGYREVISGITEMKSILHKIVNDHKKNFQPDEDPRDFIDVFLKEKMALEKKNDSKAKYFTDPSLVSTLIQAYGDGSSGIGFFVSFYLREVCRRREVQAAIYDEIVRVVGTERLPGLEDRSKLPYTMSAIKEMFRVSEVFPVLPGLECGQDTTIQGVSIKKGSIVMLNYWAVHQDPEIYENPEKFDPTRFLPERTKVEQPLTFSIGKRACAGEALVMMELFLILTTVIQRFELVPLSDDNSYCSPHEPGFSCRVKAIPRK